MILDGKKIAREIYKELEKKIKQLETPPTLGAVLV
jgi:5,10-methylene-tetrahydrofolate dehydrogenase/methenyl tetrahydrofolate cyclohydrolase